MDCTRTSCDGAEHCWYLDVAVLMDPSCACVDVWLQGLWFLFPITFVIVKGGWVSIETEEWLWTIGDFLGETWASCCCIEGGRR